MKKTTTKGISTKTAKRPRGNNAFTEKELRDKKERYLRALLLSRFNKTEAMESIGARYSDIARWKAEDPEFAEQEHGVLLQLAESCIHIVAADAHSGSDEAVSSAKWLLERLLKKHFSLRTEITGAEGSTLVEVQIVTGEHGKDRSQDRS